MLIDSFRKLFTLLDRGEKLRALLLMLMILVMALLDVVGVAAILPFLSAVAHPELLTGSGRLAPLYQWSGAADTRSFLLMFGGVLFGIVVVGMGFKLLTQHTLLRFGTMRSFTISYRLFRSYLAQPYVWFLGRHGANLGKSLLSEVDEVIRTSMIPAMELLAHATVVVALVTLLLVLRPIPMLVATTLLIGSYILIYSVMRGVLSRLGVQRVNMNTARYKLVQEALAGIKEVKLLGLEHHYARRFRGPAMGLGRVQAAGLSISQSPRQLVEIIAFGGMLGFVLYFLGRPEQGGLANLVPELGLFALGGIRLIPALQSLYRDFTMLRIGREALRQLSEEFKSAERELGSASNAVPMRLQHTLALEDITFGYPGTSAPVLRRLSLNIPVNTTVGLVGGSGAGKTTAVDILLGLLSPESGRVVVDGTAIDDTNLASWQRSIGYVPQQIYLTDDTVAANIAFGVAPERIDMQAVERSARAAELHEFVVRDLPAGYQTMVGERGVRLSGGQRQRIGIARALYHDPPVLVFDEATSALDNLTEQAVMDAVHRISGHKTIIIIAHRLQTVMNCDTIFFLKHGEVAAYGTYDELLRTCPDFHHMALGHANESSAEA